MKTKILFLLLVGAFMLYAGSKKEILVAAASSLTDVMRDCGRTFDKENPDIKVLFTFASSGVLKNQIENNAPIDAFAFASLSDSKYLDEKGFVKDGTLTILCKNSMALVINKNNRVHNLKGFEALADPRIKKIALGNFETVPAGKYAKALLVELNLFDNIKDKFIFTENVRQALTYIELGNADASIVYKTDYMISKNLIVIAEKIKVGGKEILYSAGITKSAGNKKEAVIFLNFLTGITGKNIFKKYGFIIE